MKKRMHTLSRNGITIVVHGANRWDVCFSHEDPRVQTVNISWILEMIRRRKLKPGRLTGHFTHENLHEMFKLRDIDPHVVKYIRAHPEVYEQPVLFAGLPPEPILIDGTHRVYTRWKDGILHAPAMCVSFENLQRFKVRFFIDGEEFKDSRASIVKTFQFNQEAKADGH